MKTSKWAAALALAMTGWGCSSGTKVDIGDSQQTPAGTLGSRLVDYSGNWDGYVEAFRFTDDTDRVRLTVSENGTGTITAGNDATLRPLDANDYPPAWNVTGEGLPQPGPAIMVPGLAYELTKVVVQDFRIQLQTSTLEAFRDWCELQSPVLVNADAGNYACIPQAGVKFENGSCYLLEAESTPISCGKLACQYVCQCTAAGCSVLSAADSLADIQLDAALSADGNSLSGTLVLPGNPLVRATARLTRH